MSDDVLLQPTRAQLATWARLAQKKFRRELKRFLIEGELCVREALRAKRAVEAILVHAAEVERWGAEFARARVPLYRVKSEAFARISKVETSQGVVAVAPEFSLPPRAGKWSLACEQVSDPGNCGALIRVADFFGASELFLGPESAEIWNPKVVRGSMGSLFFQPVRERANLRELVINWKGTTVALVAHGGQPLKRRSDLKLPLLLVLGHETRGLAGDLAALCTHRFTLSSHGAAESLNLVTAAAVFAFALTA